jgi:hypothetical protein
MSASASKAPVAQTLPEIVDDIVSLVRGTRVSDTLAGERLRAIASEATVDLLELFPEEVRVTDEAFEGPLTLHVTLKFGKGDEELSVAESFPGVFHGRLVSGVPVVDALDADTSSFFR